MRTLLIIAIVIGTVFAAVSQEPGKKFEPATITSVEEHRNPAMKADGTGRQYKVGLRTATRSFVVLYTPAVGSKAVEYRVGSEVSVLVSRKTIRFNDVKGTTMDMPILSTNSNEPKTPE